MEQRIPAADLIGRRIVLITQQYELNNDGFDFAWSYYHLDTGVVFVFRVGPVLGFFASDPPANANPIEHPDLDHVYNQRIEKILLPPADELYEAPYLILENGFAVRDVCTAPRGVNYAGVLILAPDEIDRDLSQLRPFSD